ncbi:MAG: hypothetical protein GKS07_09805 [Nitrosopumilus sp.]|nr:MAG: hypothetical protein GKS07_09805 [Nitrosopumilus sp.]
MIGHTLEQILPAYPKLFEEQASMSPITGHVGVKSNTYKLKIRLISNQSS